MVRREIVLAALNSGILEQGFLMGDYPLWIEIAAKHKIGFLSDKTAVYRVLPESSSNSSKLTKQLEFSKSVKSIQQYFVEKYDLKNEIIEIEIRYYRNLLFIGFNKRRQDYATQAYSYLKNSEDYKIQMIDYLYLIGSKYVFIHKILHILLEFKKRIVIQRKLTIETR